MKINIKSKKFWIITIIIALSFFGIVRAYFSMNPYVPDSYRTADFTVYSLRELPCYPLDIFCMIGKSVGLLSFTLPSQVNVGEVFVASYHSDGYTPIVGTNKFHCDLPNTCQLTVKINGVPASTYTKYSGIWGCVADLQFQVSTQTGAGTYQYSYTVICQNSTKGPETVEQNSGSLTAVTTPPACGDGRCTRPYECSSGESCSNPCKADCGEVISICGDGQCTSSFGESCTTCSNDCGVCPNNCNPLHNKLVCVGINSYYADSCGNVNDLAYNCQYGCNNGVCVICYPNNYKSCVGNNVYWYDSCGNIGSVFQNCASTESCSNGACIQSVTCTDDCSWTLTKCYDINHDGKTEIVPCGNFDNDPCKDFGTAISCGAGTTCSDTPQGATCTSTCTNECYLLGYSCENNIVVNCVKGSDGCNHKSTVQSCASNQICSNGACATQQGVCTDECDINNYPSCSPEGAITECTDINNDGCTNLWSINCESGYTCVSGICNPTGNATETFTCGNGLCEAGFGETISNCFIDCKNGPTPQGIDYTPYIIIGAIVIAGAGLIIYKKRRK